VSLESRRLAGLLLVILPTVMAGGVSLLTLLIGEPAYMRNPLRQDLWRAGHAHAGVLLVLSLVVLRYVDEAQLSARLKTFVRMATPSAAIQAAPLIADRDHRMTRRRKNDRVGCPRSDNRRAAQFYYPFDFEGCGGENEQSHAAVEMTLLWKSQDDFHRSLEISHRTRDSHISTSRSLSIAEEERRTKDGATRRHINWPLVSRSLGHTADRQA
jgi:hypothetical protein